MGKGTKRASPGADEEKDILGELGEVDAKAIGDIQREQMKLELFLERLSQEKLQPIYEKRRPLVKAITNFWPVALMNHELVQFHCQHNADQTALAYLEDLWVVRGQEDHRCFTLEFHFKENQFFEDKVLKKEYKYTPKNTDVSRTPDENGVTDAMLDFDWERDVTISGNKINWKGDDKALTKQYPREKYEDEEDDDDLPADAGSFFNFFEYPDDVYDIGPTIATEVFTDAIDYFMNKVEGRGEDSDDEDDEDDEDQDEIDLEKPRTKKQRV